MCTVIDSIEASLNKLITQTEGILKDIKGCTDGNKRETSECGGKIRDISRVTERDKERLEEPTSKGGSR